MDKITPPNAKITPPNAKIIGFTGKAFSGKDSAAATIRRIHESDADILAFAGPLKDACKLLFNFSNDQLYDPILKEIVDERWGRSPRKVMQWLGSDILRNNINQDFFIMNMKQRMEPSKATYILIPDVRFDNEAEFIRSLGGKIIKIIRPNAKTTVHSEHVTEQDISPNLVDCIISNDSTLEEFENRVKFIVNNVLFPIANHSNHFAAGDFTDE